MTKAGFLTRFAAIFIDSILFWGVGYAIHVPAFGLLYIVYEAVLVAQWNGQTIGKKILGIKVVTTGGGRLDGVKSFIRVVSKILSALPLDLGFLWALWDSKSQTWHDKIADTYVVKA